MDTLMLSDNRDRLNRFIYDQVSDLQIFEITQNKYVG